jgi:hypothetical protein
MIKKLLFLLVFLTSLNLTAQLYKSHNWKKVPVFHNLDEENKKLSSIAIKEKHLIQYHKPLIGELALYDTKHSIIRVNTEKGIQKHNRVYIPMYGVVKVIDIKARVIHKDGKIINLNKNNIKELDNVKGYGGFKIFALEGVEKNTQLEYFYTLKKRPSSLGNITIQKNYKIKNAEVIIRKPFFLATEIKSYNNFPSLIKKKVPGNKIAYTAIQKNIDAMVDETSSTSGANKMKVVYLIQAGNSSANYQWKNFSSSIQNNFLKIKPKKHEKLILDFQKVKTQFDKDSLIIEISNFVKENYTIRKNGSSYEDLKSIYNKKSATETAILKVYSCLFNYYEIPYNIVLTSNRYYNKFDRYFFSNSNLGFAMFYFPENEKYVCPSQEKHNLGFPPSRFSNNDGIFITKKSYFFKKIDLPTIEHTVLDRKMDVLLDLEQNLVKVKGIYTISGYRAINSRMAYNYFKKEDLEKFKKMEAASNINDVDFNDFSVKNKDTNLGLNNIPFIINYNYSTEEIVEESGNNFIFNVGKLIGRQTELYQEEKRVNPVELAYPNQYKYTITIKVPADYVPKNLEKLNTLSTFNMYGELAAEFSSKYTYENDIIHIAISEKYVKTNMAVSYYPKYKNVVNAAYNFSKKVILFKKK